jgi:predicted ribosome quality control (RQC) complex YloA/Tae2 family protein
VLARLTDAAGEEVELPLDVRRTARENAARFFSDSKEAVGKARRTAEQLEESRRAMERLAKDGLLAAAVSKKDGAARKRHWFERYRWFLSSDGNTVVGGRDAASNDRIVKRHLGEGDAYVHADFHGAPSVVVKRVRGEIPERTLSEACLFALAMSKAWSAGLASGSAYWVHPDQVSKTPESGEFVPRGGFIIRGRKNMYDDLELRLAIGLIELEGGQVLMCGPETAFTSRVARTISIQPGDEEPRAVARKIAAGLGCDLEEAARLLPPGKSQVILPA